MGLFDSITGIFDNVSDYISDDLLSIFTDSANPIGSINAPTTDKSFWDFLSDPDILAAAITSFPQFVSIANQPDPTRNDAFNNQLALDQLALNKEELASRERIAGMQAGAQAAAVAAQREAATKQALTAANNMFSQAQDTILRGRLEAAKGQPELIQRANEAKILAATKHGEVALAGTNNVAGAIQNAALSRAR